MLPVSEPVKLAVPDDGFVCEIIRLNVVPAAMALGGLQLASVHATENCPRSTPLGARTFPPPFKNVIVQPPASVHVLGVGVTNAEQPGPLKLPIVLNVTCCAAAGSAPRAIAAAPTSAALLSIRILLPPPNRVVVRALASRSHQRYPGASPSIWRTIE